MHKIIVTALCAIALSLSSCTSTYYYSTLNTTNSDVEKVENGDFLFENDSLWIAYCFKGEDAPIQITVFNKLDIPLFVNWQQSSLIINNVAYPYSDGQVNFVGNANGVTDEMYGQHQTYSNIEINGQLPRHISFIPPQAMVSYSTLRLAARFDHIKNKEYIKGLMLTTQDETVEIKRISYDLQNTPLRFESYLTVYSKPEKAQAYRTDFYINNLIKTKIKPQHLPSEMAERGDTFYQQKRPDNTGWEILGGAVLFTGSVAIDVLVNKNYE